MLVLIETRVDLSCEGIIDAEDELCFAFKFALNR